MAQLPELREPWVLPALGTISRSKWAASTRWVETLIWCSTRQLRAAAWAMKGITASAAIKVVQVLLSVSLLAQCKISSNCSFQVQWKSKWLDNKERRRWLSSNSTGPTPWTTRLLSSNNNKSSSPLRVMRQECTQSLSLSGLLNEDEEIDGNTPRYYQPKSEAASIVVERWISQKTKVSNIQ